MENQVDENGDQITLTPTTLAVKTLRMQLIAKRIVRSQEAGTTVNYTGGTRASAPTASTRAPSTRCSGMLPDERRHPRSRTSGRERLVPVRGPGGRTRRSSWRSSRASGTRSSG
jgi:hypothetical protein